MKITHVTCTTSQIGPMKAFYANTLQMPVVDEGGDRFTVQVGTTRLTFQWADVDSFHHFAFGIDQAAFERMRTSIGEAVGFLADDSGTTEFFAHTWQSPQLYFVDPQQNILEMLPSKPGEAVPAGTPWVHIREVGVPLPNLAAFRNRISDTVPSAMPAESDTFQFYGDAMGVLVLVKEGRSWFPTMRPATMHKLIVEVIGIRAETLQFEGVPGLTIHSRVDFSQ